MDITLNAELCDKTIEQGKKYIESLAQKFNIKLKSDNPFIIYKSIIDSPFGRKLNKHYPNYDQGKQGKITESLMVKGLLQEVSHGKNTNIISAPLQIDGTRPTTAITVYTAIQKLIQEIKDGNFGDKKQFFILLQSNQPYVERQTITAQQEANKVLYEHKLDLAGYAITVDGVGCACKEEISIIHSVFGALVAEKWGAATASGTPSKRSIKDLLFQTRKSKAILAPQPCALG